MVRQAGAGPPPPAPVAHARSADAAAAASAAAVAAQELWPDHCVRGTMGASLPDRFRVAVPWKNRCLVARNGFRKNVDSYSAFFDNDRASRTGLMQEVHQEWKKYVNCNPQEQPDLPKEQKDALAHEQARAKKRLPRRLFIVGLCYEIGIKYSAGAGGRPSSRAAPRRAGPLCRPGRARRCACRQPA